MSVLSEPAFEDRFGTVLAPDGGYYWEYDDIKAQNIQGDRIWTARDGDAGIDTILTPGYGLVNRFAYVVTERSWTDEDAFWIDYVLIRGCHMAECPCDEDPDGERDELDCTCDDWWEDEE